MLTPEQDKLIAAFLEGEAASSELLAECKKDPAVLKRVTDLVATDRLLQLISPEESEELFEAELRARLEAKQDTRFNEDVRRGLTRSRRTRIQWKTAFAIAACLAFAGFLFMMLRPEPSVGQIIATRDVLWGDTVFQPGDHIQENQLKIIAGYSEVLLRSGVTLILEGPVELEFLSDNEIFLREGLLVADVPERAIGFTVDTPNSKVVDLGTVFAMSVSQSGDSEVHVLQGEVKARPLNGKHFTHLIENEALMIDAEQQVKAIRSDPDRFRRALPGRSASNPEFLHWSFDSESTVAACGGSGINGEFFPGKLMGFDGGVGPLYQSGQFGKALYFNGVDAYVATDFPGIGGTRPRTIAFWTKIPKDFSIHNGYGIMGWGLFKQGAGWQISPNPTAEEGPLGRLRIIGTTDLRDNRWHHIAIVMYGGEKADLSTHVLLYVDGNLEKTSIKSVAHIDTELKHPDSVPLMFGRNLRFTADEAELADRFFKGWIDEVFIFDTALEQNQIRHLLQTNQWSAAPTANSLLQ
jgi:hypothetical protein